MTTETYSLDKTSSYQNYVYAHSNTHTYVVKYIGDGLAAPAVNDFSKTKTYQLDDGRLIYAESKSTRDIKDTDLVIASVNNDDKTITICPFNEFEPEPRGTRAAPAA